MRALLLLCVPLLVTTSCDKQAPAEAPVRAAAAPATETPKAWPRLHTPDLDALRTALDLGPLAEVERLMPAASAAGPELPLLRARYAAACGRGIEALRQIEEARTANPDDPSVYATAAEIYASSDGFDSAAAEILRGEKRCGPSAEFLRARGIVSISQSGRAAMGLAELESARAADPALPFVARALGQTHLLLGKEAVKRDQVALALEHAQLSVSFDPHDLDAQRFVSECQAARGEWDAALASLRALVAQGHPLQSELALMEKRAGVACLLRGDRPAALAHFLEARARGLSDAELATGARLLAETSQEHLDAGLAALEKAELSAAEREFRTALVYDVDSLAAQNHLAVVLYRLQRFDECVVLWKKVLATAHDEELELPDPVHINLAEAQRAGGDPAAARATLAQYLEGSPQGKWAERTRVALEKLPH